MQVIIDCCFSDHHDVITKYQRPCVQLYTRAPPAWMGLRRIEEFRTYRFCPSATSCLRPVFHTRSSNGSFTNTSMCVREVSKRATSNTYPLSDMFPNTSRVSVLEDVSLPRTASLRSATVQLEISLETLLGNLASSIGFQRVTLVRVNPTPWVCFGALLLQD